MNITRGPMLEAYARLIDEPIESLMVWINACVNEGWPGSPDTEKARLEHVKNAITERIDNSITEHIKRSIAEERRLAS